MLLFLVLAVNPPSFKFYGVTRSYSSRPFLCALGTCKHSHMHIQTLVDMQQHSTFPWPSLYTKWVFLPSYTIACRPASWQRDVVHWLFTDSSHSYPAVYLHCLLKSYFPACFPKLLTMMTQPGLSLELSQPPTFLTSPQFTDCPTCSLSVRNLVELLPATVAEPSKRKLLHVSYVGSYKLKPYNFPSSPPSTWAFATHDI